MKADVRSGIGREEYLLFFFGCSVDPGRGDCPSRNHCGQCCFECEDLLFFFHRAIDRTSGFVVFAFSFLFFSFLFFSFLFFARFLQSAFPASYTREAIEYRERNGASDIFGRDCVFPLLTYAWMCIATIICVSRNCFLKTEK